MAETLNDTAGSATTAVGTSVTVTLGTGPAAGELLLAAVGHSDDYPNVPSGWTQADESAITGVTRIFYKVATGAEGTSYVFTAPSPGAMSARVARYSGLGALHSDAANSAEGTNQIIFGNLVTTVADVFVFAAAEVHATTLPASDLIWNSSFTPIAADVKSVSGTKRSLMSVATRTLSATGTLTGVTASFTPVGTTNDQGAMVAFLFASTALAISAGPDLNRYPTDVPTLTGVATGGSGTKTYAWTKTSGPSLTFGSPTAAASTLTFAGGVGTYVARITVTDASGSAFDEVTITVADAPDTTNYASITVSTGWTLVGGTLPGILSDASDATYVRSSNIPSSQPLDGLLGPVKPPVPGADVTLTVRPRRNLGTTGSVVANLYNGVTLVSTATQSVTSASFGALAFTFPAADLTGVPATAWTGGMRLVLLASAS